MKKRVKSLKKIWIFPHKINIMLNFYVSNNKEEGIIEKCNLHFISQEISSYFEFPSE